MPQPAQLREARARTGESHVDESDMTVRNRWIWRTRQRAFKQQLRSDLRGIRGLEPHPRAPKAYAAGNVLALIQTSGRAWSMAELVAELKRSPNTLGPVLTQLVRERKLTTRKRPGGRRGVKEWGMT